MRLDEGQVSVWMARVPAALPGGPVLDRAEERRRDSFRFREDGERWASCRSILRRLAGAYLARAPESLEFRLGQWGKPHLEGLSFNLSHSGDLCLLAFSREQDLGVDVEACRRIATEELKVGYRVRTYDDVG